MTIYIIYLPFKKKKERCILKTFTFSTKCINSSRVNMKIKSKMLIIIPFGIATEDALR